MDEQTMLEALKVDLGISTGAYDKRLFQYLAMAETAIREEGITLDSQAVQSDGNLQVMYAAWLWRKRAGNTGSVIMDSSVTGMPRMLRYMLNNRLFSEKTNGGT